MVNSYATEELHKLSTMVMEYRIQDPANLPFESVGCLLRDIIVGAADRPHVVKEKLFQNTSRIIQSVMYELPLDDMPLYMGHSHPDIAAIANWRLLISK